MLKYTAKKEHFDVCLMCSSFDSESETLWNYFNSNCLKQKSKMKNPKLKCCCLPQLTSAFQTSTWFELKELLRGGVEAAAGGEVALLALPDGVVDGWSGGLHLPQVELRTIHRFSQSQWRPLLGPFSASRHLPVLSHLRHNAKHEIRTPTSTQRSSGRRDGRVG